MVATPIPLATRSTPWRLSVRTLAMSLCALGVLSGVLSSAACSGDDPTATTAVHVGGLCGAGCAAAEVCDPSLGCVECSNDSACPTAKPKCVQGACSVCATNADCPASMHACSPVDHTCAAACGVGSSVTCAAGLLCDPTIGACVTCRSDADCAGTGRPLCDSSRGTCVACLTNGNCASSAPLCEKAHAVCVQCITNADCPALAPVCTADLRCQTGCVSDRGCGTTQPFCDVATGECRECRFSSDCESSAAPYCAGGSCTACPAGVVCATVHD